MVKQVIDVYRCDKCNKEGKRYVVVFDDGTLTLDRCETHAKKLEALRNEDGEWEAPKTRASTFKKSTVQDLQEARARFKQKGGDD